LNYNALTSLLVVAHTVATGSFSVKGCLLTAHKQFMWVAAVWTLTLSAHDSHV